ncbi:FAD/NAD(P)-binding protein [Streptomyces sp. NRRL WC-3549]|uniref:FAD/NAD(P)-binding protein n=1 Tax=Streptomyces sp. NRRL WC-3549 TaxID=1463925 RepID=UPI0004C8C84D|nr:FAD/NAD(P)-binding protein [Streptomyces sp. NRRL WC-3549]
MTTDTSVNPTPIRLAIVGGGPTCTYVLERLAALVHAHDTSAPLEIVVYDLSGEFGPGQVHSPDQTRTSYLNRVVGQVAFAADESVVDAGPLLPAAERPTLLDWCRKKFQETGDPRFDLAAEDWPKRYVHGLALKDQFKRYVEILRASDGVTVTLRRSEVVDLEERGDRFALLTADGAAPYEADYVLMLTGHSSNRPELDPHQAAWAAFAAQHGKHLIPNAYPLERSLDPARTGPGTTVACLGMGLTGIDVLLYLTEGRGGTFERDGDGQLRYRPTGAEPDSIVAFSRSGLFTFARPYNEKERDIATLEYKGAFLTTAAVAELRRTVGVVNVIGGHEKLQLDFEAHVFPLVHLEMALIYYSTLYGPEFRESAVRVVRPAYDKFLADAEAFSDHHEAAAFLLAPLDELARSVAAQVDEALSGRRTVAGQPVLEGALRTFLTVVYGAEQTARLLTHAGRPREFAAAVAAARSPWRHAERAAENVFSWERTISPVPRTGYAGPEEYVETFLDFLDVDIRWASQGNLSNPAKAAADAAWRDLRGVVIDAVDFGGLRASSHRTFLGVYTPHHNRLCQGASVEAMEKVAALIRSGHVDVSVGPEARVGTDEEAGRFRVDGRVTGSTKWADVLVDARVHAFDAERDVMPVYPNLLRRGLVRKWANPGVGEADFVPGGLDLTPEFHPVRADGTVEPRITFLGPPSEGVMYHQIGALRPNKDHHVIRDILCWINAFIPQGAPTGTEPQRHERTLA